MSNLRSTHSTDRSSIKFFHGAIADIPQYVSVFVLLRLDRITSVRAKRTLASLQASVSIIVYDRIDIHVFSIIMATLARWDCQ